MINGRSRLALVLAAGAVLTLAPALTPAATAAARPFAATSPFNTPIGSSPAVDPNGRTMITRATRHGVIYANLYEYSVPIYTAAAGTPTYAVSCDMEGEWGRCPLSQQPLPIPADARPSTGDDGAMAVIDPTSGTIGEYWRARRTESGWAAAWGAVNQLYGSGWGGSSTGSGASRLAGVIRVSEIEAGTINHALVLQSDTVCRQIFRAPAIKTDGDSVRTDCISEGARLQLDPSLDLNTLTGLTPAERIIARALQVYGAYVIDRGGAPLSLSFERPPDATASYPGSVYSAAGMTWDYYGLGHVPWSRMRVLRGWNS